MAPLNENPDAEPDLLLEVEQLIAELEHGHGPTVGERVTRLLKDVDAIHRAGLTHLMQAIRSMGGEAFVNRLIADPAIRILLMSYDLVAADRRLSAEEALDTVRGHLHAHGVDVEILEVVGGVVYVRLHGLAGSAIPEQAVLQDLEEALRAGFIGFQELVTRDPHATGPVISIGALRRANRPVYRDVFDAATLKDGEMRAVDVEGQSALFARVDGEYLAVSNRCAGTPLPLEFSTLEGAVLRCSWHGCRYDLRTGGRVDGAGDRLAVFPVSVENGIVRIAIDVEPAVRGSH